MKANLVFKSLHVSLVSICYVSMILLQSCQGKGQEADPDPPLNVLFIAIDDLNDWIGPLGGHPQVLTPNMDRFCEEGAMVFTNSSCAAPICGPSRSALLSGFMPNRTGVYGNSTNMIYSDLVKENATLPEYFAKHGYHTMANGKIFHKHTTANGVDFGHWAFQTFERSRRYTNNGPDPEYLTSSSGVIRGERKQEYAMKGSKLRWGPTKCGLEDMVDHKVAIWAQDQLMADHDKPFFMAVGFIKPHLSWFVPKAFFDLYDYDSLKVPEVLNEDLEDILRPDGSLEHQATADYLWVKEHGLEQEATQAYLASVSFVDHCLGIVMDALKLSGHADNTIVVIWGDHGYHLGEKLRYRKNTLWIESTRAPFMLRTPEMKKAEYSKRTVSFIDIFPTLISLCGLPEKELDGHDFSTLLQDPEEKWEYPGITVSSEGTSIRDESYHYISYLSGTEELYDLETDPMEWYNLVNDPEYSDKKEELRIWIPDHREKSHGIHYPNAKNYVNADLDPTLKAGRDLNELK